MAGWQWLLAAMAVAAIVISVRSFSRGAIRRTAPAMLEPHGIVPSLRVRADGSSEWYPPGQPTMYVPGVALPVHRWWDAERGPMFATEVAFEIPDEVAPDLLARATKRALRAATQALPARGKVRASAAHRDDPGPSGTVSVRLAVQGIGADASWARDAAEAFARAFMVGLKQEGHLADRRA